MGLSNDFAHTIQSAIGKLTILVSHYEKLPSRPELAAVRVERGPSGSFFFLGRRGTVAGWEDSVRQHDQIGLSEQGCRAFFLIPTKFVRLQAHLPCYHRRASKHRSNADGSETVNKSCFSSFLVSVALRLITLTDGEGRSFSFTFPSQVDCRRDLCMCVCGGVSAHQLTFNWPSSIGPGAAWSEPNFFCCFLVSVLFCWLSCFFL